jgi:hypothetical protein
MQERNNSDFLTDSERASGGIDHSDGTAAREAATAKNLVASQAEQYNSNSPVMHKTIIAENPPPHDDLSTPDDGALTDEETE